MSVTISVAGEGDKDTDRNIITPEFTAEALRNVRGYDCGVLKNSFYTATDSTGVDRVDNGQYYNWECSVGSYGAGVAGGAISSGITVRRGMATAYGYDIRSDSSYTLTTVYSDATGADTTITAGSSTKYLFVYLEINLGENPAGGYIRVHDNGNAPVWTSKTQDNLITTQGGKYQMPLHRITINSSGTVTAIESWQTLNLAETIERPLTAHTALYAVTQDQGTADNTVATTAFVETAVKGLASDTQDNFNDLTTEINSKFSSLVSTVNTALNFSSTTFTAAGVEFWIKRLGGAVCGGLNVTFLTTTQVSAIAGYAPTYKNESGYTLQDIGTIPEGYRPTSEQTIVLAGSNAMSYGSYGDSYLVAVITVATDGTMTMQSYHQKNSSYVTTAVSAAACGFGWQTTATTASSVSVSAPQVTPTVSVTLTGFTDSVGDGNSDVKLKDVQTATAGSKITFGLEVHGYARTITAVTATYKRYTSDTAYSSSTLTVTANSDGTYSVTPSSDTSTTYLKRVVEVSVTIGYEGATA